MYECVISVSRSVKKSMPAVTGFMRASVSWTVQYDQSTGMFEGKVFSQVPWVKPFEEGISPGKWPNVGWMEAWAEEKAKRHSFIREMTPKRFAFVVARKIKRKGLKGRWVFRDVFRALRPYIEGRLSAAVTRIAARANKGAK